MSALRIRVSFADADTIAVSFVGSVGAVTTAQLDDLAAALVAAAHRQSVRLDAHRVDDLDVRSLARLERVAASLRSHGIIAVVDATGGARPLARAAA